MNKNLKLIVLPLLIIVIAGLVGANVIISQKTSESQKSSLVSDNDSRLLTLKAPGMFCIGCSASVEGYLGSIGGVQSVNASLATKQVDVVYDPLLVDKDTILASEILDSYGKEFISDEKFTGDSQIKNTSSASLPQYLAAKLQEAAGRVGQLDSQESYQPLFDQINQAITLEDYQLAEALLDKLIAQLKN